VHALRQEVQDSEQICTLCVLKSAKLAQRNVQNTPRTMNLVKPALKHVKNVLQFAPHKLLQKHKLNYKGEIGFFPFFAITFGPLLCFNVKSSIRNTSCPFFLKI
jgi:hypothetical protein